MSITKTASKKKSTPGKERRHAAFFDVIDASLSINTPEQFCNWVQGDLQHIFPHGMMVCGLGDTESFGTRVQHIITSNFPIEYVRSLQAGGLTSSPIIVQWLQTRRPVLFEIPEQHENSTWLENYKRYDLRNVAAHGLFDMKSKAASYFSFSQIPDKLTQRHADMLDRLVPHLHVALVRVFDGAQTESSKPKQTLSVLTQREQEVLQWLCSGKTNWEIAQVLHLSDNTIKNHVQRILIKLKVNTRAQAVAKAVAEGLLPK